MRHENQMMKQFLSKFMQDTRPIVMQQVGQTKQFDDLKMIEMKKIYDAVLQLHQIANQGETPKY